MNKEIPLSVEETGMDYAGAKESLIVQPIRQPSCTTAKPALVLTLIYGNIEQQTGDVIAAPLLSSKPSLGALKVTKALQCAEGEKFSKLFTAALNGRKELPPGSTFEIPLVGGSYNLKYKYMIFIVCTPWDRSDRSSLKNLRNGIYNLLEKCHSRSVESVIMSAIGTGVALNIPNDTAATILGEEMKKFVVRHPDTSIKTIHLVIKKHLESEVIFITFRETLLAMDFGDKIILRNETGACFQRINIGECMKRNAGHLAVSVVYGDIVEETTNAIVNSTNFEHWCRDSVAHSIFSAAGEEIVKEARESRLIKGSNFSNGVLMTSGGHLKHNWILHCDCEGKLDNIRNLIKTILLRCNEVGLQSVAIPAIGTGGCQLCPHRVANLIMEAISSVVKDKKLESLSTVRLVTKSPCIYHVFCAELNRKFPDL